MTSLVVSVVIVALLWFVWRFVTALFRKQPAEPTGPDSFVVAGRKRGPSSRGAAVALEEPDEEDTQSFPPQYH
jgi:predicted permease